VLNRETACFITVFFVIWEWVRLAKSDVTIKSRLLQIAPHALVQATIWIAIKMLLAKAYAHNPVEVGSVAGGLFHTMLAYNLHEIIKPQQWPVLLSVCGFSLPFSSFSGDGSAAMDSIMRALSSCLPTSRA